MAGYSGTPLPRKLGIKPGHTLALVEAPDGFGAILGELPEGVRVAGGLAAAFDVAVIFVGRVAELEKRLTSARKKMRQDGAVWIAWPKRASGVATDVTEDRVREAALAIGLVDNKVCAIDETWSGLRCVIRLVDRKS
jgi:hypothetical protein